VVEISRVEYIFPRVDMMLLLSNYSMRLTAILITLNVSVDGIGLMVDDTPRAGNFEPLAHLPKHKSVVLGLISSKLPELEDPKQISSRLDEAATILGDPEKKRICLSPQCGFASHIEGNKVSSPLCLFTIGHATRC